MQKAEKYVGLSTNCMPRVNIWEAVDLIEDAGLRAFEIHLGDFEGAVGDPWLIPHAGVWPRSFGKNERTKLRKRLKFLDTLTIHGTPVDINIAALNPGIREESWRQYEEALELAADLGAGWMTYHPGHGSSSIVNPKFVEDCQVQFMERIIPRAKKLGIKLGYETFNVNLLKRIPDPIFGILLDIGHAVMNANKFCPGRGDTQTIIKWIEYLGDRLVEIHAHNVINWSEVPIHGVAHRSFDYGLCLDIQKIAGKLKKLGLKVPIISEIYESTVEKAVATTVHTREMIVKGMEE